MSAVDLRKVLESIRELNMSGRDENGHRWANSDLIEQEAHAGLVALAEAAISPVSAGKVKAIAEAFEAGALSVHREWVRAHADGEGPPRGDPEFSEAAADYAALQPGDGWLGIESAKLDRSQMIVAVPDQHRTGWIVGEAYYDPEAKDWFWAGTSANDYFGGPISELNHWLPELWQPMPEPSAPPAALPLGEETR